MAISISFAWHLVVNNQPLSESARMQIQDKLLFYQQKCADAIREANRAGNNAEKAAKILEFDDKLKQ